MPVRLPDTYYTTVVLDGQVQETGIKQAPPQFYQGEDCIFDVYLQYLEKPVIPEEWIIEVIIKKSEFAENILWKGIYGQGLYKNGNPGFYQIIFPSQASSLFLAGAYHIDVKLCQRIGANPGVKDLSIIIFQGYFDLNLAAASPNPKLAATMQVEVSYDPETGVTTTTYVTTEQTAPPLISPDQFNGAIPVQSFISNIL